MDQPGTLKDLFELAIQAELYNQSFYEQLGKMFINHPKVANFWFEYAAEEAEHARWMKNLRSRVNEFRLAEPADPDIWKMANRISQLSISQICANIENLKDALDLANEIEHGETNLVTEFLICNFSGDPHAVAFLRSQIRDHVGNLVINFPLAMIDSSKQEIRPLRK